MGDNIAMAKEGTQFSGDGVTLSWPQGGEQEVIKLPQDERPGRVLERIASKVIMETSKSVTKPVPLAVSELRLLEGEEAAKVLAEPPGPVLTQQFDPRTRELENVEVAGPRNAAKSSADAGESNAAPGSFDSMNHEQLKAEAGARGLPKSGSKVKLAAAIKEFDADKAKADAKAAADAEAEAAKAAAEATEDEDNQS